MFIPRGFEEKFKRLLGKEYKKLVSCVSKRKTSIRINTLKSKIPEIVFRLQAQGFSLKPIPWFKAGFWIEGNSEKIGKTVEYFLGCYYLQDASSMVPPLFLEPSPEDRILDMCAAPGSKTTQLAQMMNNKGLIVAMDDKLERLKALRMNIQRLGVKNTLVAWMDARKLRKTGIKFSKILLDAPCSASGTLITIPSVIKTWSPSKVFRLSRLQKSLLCSGIQSLENDGILVYSTCSLDPEENEEVIDYAIRKFGVEVEEFRIKGLKYGFGITEWMGKKFDSKIENAVRIYPFHNQTEGFFICRLRK